MNVADIPASVVVTNTTAMPLVVDGLTFEAGVPRMLLLSPMADQYKLAIWNGLYATTGLTGIPTLFYVDPNAYAGPVPPVVAPGGTTGTIPVNPPPVIAIPWSTAYDARLVVLSPSGGGVLDVDSGALVWDIDTMEQVTV